MSFSSESDEQSLCDGMQLSARVTDILDGSLDVPLSAGLYLVATPIGNLSDISLRALSTLARADTIAAEDTRHSRKLLQHFGIRSQLISYHDHNGDVMGPKIVSMIEAGTSVALISDAGTPLISDPGFKLARLVRAAGGQVNVVPGPSAVTAALCLSGLPTDRFFFEGFLPSKQASRKKRLDELKEIDASLVLFETVKRVGAVLADMALVMGPRQGVILRELTKLHEEVIAGTLDELAAQLTTRDLKGELVLVIGPPVAQEVDDEQILSHLERLIEHGTSVRDSVSQVMSDLNLPKRRVYDLALNVKDKLEGTRD